jgi:hypothetical protein
VRGVALGVAESAVGGPGEFGQAAALDHHRQALVLARRIEYRIEEAHALTGIARVTGDDECGAQAVAHSEAMGIHR